MGEGKLTIEYAEATNEQRMRAYWADFCDADPVPLEFADDMEAAGLIEAVPATGREADDDMFWTAKYGDHRPAYVYRITDAGRAALRTDKQP